MRWLRDPLVHFLALGAMLFGLVTFTGGDGSRSAQEIVVTTGQIASLQAIFAKTWQRPPTAAETESLVAEYVRDEVLYREALAMGLDKDDTIIRRRLRQKLEFVTKLGSEAEPMDAELQAFVREHPDWFRDEPRFSFSHAYFGADNAITADAAELERLRRSLEDGSARETAMGDAFLPGFDFQSLARSDVAKIFGEDFVTTLSQIAPGRWEGPIVSAYGTHLVRIQSRSEAVEMPFPRIRELARRELMNRRRVAAGDALYKELRARYVVSVEKAPTQALDPPASQVTQ